LLERSALGLAQRLSCSDSGGTGSIGLADFVPWLTPHWERPDHLRPLVEALERAEHGDEARVLISLPPRHGKTELLLHTIAWWLKRRPEHTIGYVTYAAELARSKSRFARDYALRAGVVLREDSAALHEWRTPKLGGLLATGIGGPLTGHGLELALVDDPHKNRAEAESKTFRDQIHEWFTSTLMTRIEPGGSVFVVHGRWHPDDLIGRLSKDAAVGWESINLPAIAQAGDALGRPLGAALWPSRWPEEALARKRIEVGAYDWASLYDGSPRPRGGSVFRDVQFYNAPPALGYRIAIGVDLAFTAKTSANSSVAIVLACDGRFFYVLDVIRRQVQANEFASTLKTLRVRFPWAPMRFYYAGAEKGVIDLMNELKSSLHLAGEPATADKFVRAQPVAAAWNGNPEERQQGTVLVPREAPWLDAFVSEIASFTGINDAADDQVDALAAAYDLLKGTAPITVAVGGARSWAGGTADI
jgi:predicted phage terminase large subunit-like protein